MKKKVSIILPVFNVEEYLKKCLESILNQTYTNIEIIIINDGSTDRSYEICKKYASIDDRVVLLNKKNEGLALARKDGFEKSTGDYILFVDSDDYINKDFIEHAINILKNKSIDIILPQIIYKYSINEERFITKLNENKIYHIDEVLKMLIINKDLKDFVWGKIFKRELIESKYFGESRIFEDIDFTHRVILNAKLIQFQPKCEYYYLQREGSLLSNKFDRSKTYLITATEKMLKNILSSYPQMVAEAEYRYIMAILMLLIPIRKEKLQITEGYEDYYKKYLKVLTSLSPMNRYLSLKQRIHLIVFRLIYLKSRVYNKFKK